MLDQPSLRQLSQRITSRSHLEPLSLDETRRYVKHRLVVAGGNGSEIADDAVARVYQLSDGVPRVVNVLCDRALVGAFGRTLKTVDVSLVDAAAAEVLPPNLAKKALLSRGRFAEAIGLFVIGLLLMLLLRYGVGAKPQTSPPSATPSATPVKAVSPLAPPSPAATPAASTLTAGSKAPPSETVEITAVRCGSVARSRSAAIAAVEGFLGTPGFDSAQATLTFDQWRLLKLPAIIPFKTALGSCEAAVVPLDPATTRVSDSTGEYEMDNQHLKETYLGTAIICFVDRDGVLAKPERARFDWARKVLERRSLIPRSAPDTAVTAGLARVGARVGLKDKVSVEGALLAALYSLEGGALRRPGTTP